MDRTPGFEPGGCGFESCRLGHLQVFVITKLIDFDPQITSWINSKFGITPAPEKSSRGRFGNKPPDGIAQATAPQALN